MSPNGEKKCLLEPANHWPPKALEHSLTSFRLFASLASFFKLSEASLAAFCASSSCINPKRFIQSVFDRTIKRLSMLSTKDSSAAKRRHEHTCDFFSWSSFVFCASSAFTANSQYSIQIERTG